MFVAAVFWKTEFKKITNYKFPDLLLIAHRCHVLKEVSKVGDVGGADVFVCGVVAVAAQAWFAERCRAREVDEGPSVGAVVADL